MNTVAEKLLIDVGNTNLKWSIGVGQILTPPVSIGYKGVDIYSVLTSHFSRIAKPGQVIMANVANKAIGNAVKEWCWKEWRLTVKEIQSEPQALGVTSAYREPSQLGVDRWLTLVASHQAGLTPACIVDCGTAITFDIVGDNGMHRGGLILPGFGLMFDALAKGTNLEKQPVSESSSLLGKSTSEAVSLAAFQAAAALVEKLVRLEQKKTGLDFQVILTGSDAKILASFLDVDYQIVPNLVMEGLSLYADLREI